MVDRLGAQGIPDEETLRRRYALAAQAAPGGGGVGPGRLSPAQQRLWDRIRQLGARASSGDPFDLAQVRSPSSLLDVPRFAAETGLRGLGDIALNSNNPLSGIARLGFGAGQVAADSPELARLLAGVLTEPRGPNQPVETALAASEAGMGAGMGAGSGQAPLGAPTSAATMPPTPPGGLTRGDSGGAIASGGLSPMTSGTEDADALRRAARGSGFDAAGLQSTALAPLPSSTSMIGQRVETRPGVAGSLSRVDDIASSYSPRRILGMPGQTAAGLPLPSTLVGGGGARGMSPTALEEIEKNPFLMADILNQQRGRSPTTDMWAQKERGDATSLAGLFPLFDDPNNPDDMAEQAAYLQRGIEGRRQPGGRLDFRGALLAKLGDEAGSGEVLQGLGIPMSLAPGELPGAAQKAGQLVNAVQVQGGRLPAMAAARAQRVQEEIIRQHSMALQNGEEFGQPQISAIIRAYA